MRQFFPYYGSKWRLVPEYPSPRLDLLVEPFAGAASYATRYSDCDVLLFDPDPNIYLTWEFLIGATPKDILDLPLVWDWDLGVRALDIPKGAQTLLGWWLGRAGSTPYTRPSAWMRSGKYPNSFWGERVRARISEQVRYIKHWEVRRTGYLDSPDLQASWFIDPPYRVSGRKYRFGSKDLNFELLSDWCQARCGQVLVCEQRGADWLPFGSFKRALGTNGKDRTGISHEVLWTSYRCGKIVHPDNERMAPHAQTRRCAWSTRCGCACEEAGGIGREACATCPCEANRGQARSGGGARNTRDA